MVACRDRQFSLQSSTWMLAFDEQFVNGYPEKSTNFSYKSTHIIMNTRPMIWMLTSERNFNISSLGMRNKALTLVKDMSYTCPGATEMPRCNSPLSYAVWKCNQLPGLHCKWTHIRCMFSLGNEIKVEILGNEIKRLRVKTWGIYLCHLWRHNWGVNGRGRIEHLHVDTISTFRMRNWKAQTNCMWKMRSPAVHPAPSQSSLQVNLHSIHPTMIRNECSHSYLVWEAILPCKVMMQFLSRYHICTNFTIIEKRRRWGKLTLQSYIAIFSLHTSIAHALPRWHVANSSLYSCMLRQLNIIYLQQSSKLSLS